LDSSNIFAYILGCRDANGRGGLNNLGGYCNPKIDDLARSILVEVDSKKRDVMIGEAYRLAYDDVSHIPLHQQWLTWGISKKVSVVQPANNGIWFYLFRKE
jgi:peptide/nickel transport system substrate-binding protein